MDFQAFSAAQISSALIALTYLAVSCTIVVHILLTKAGEKTALAWAVLVVSAPILGALIYLLFGINRINITARRLRHKKVDPLLLNKESVQNADLKFEFTAVKLLHEGKISYNSTVEALVNGDAAYPQMLKAIEEAKQEISLTSYIFNYDKAGKMFVKALADAQRRGVKVRVIIDDIGRRYSFPSTKRMLKKQKIAAYSFLPIAMSKYSPFLNLRNHRKILICDGHTVFSGGMNISSGNLSGLGSEHRINDIHFKLTGEVVGQFSKIFEQDWTIATGEDIALLPCKKAPGQSGDLVFANAIPDGPDEYFKMYENSVLIALASALKSIKIMTPYFLPSDAVLASIRTACYRGINVELIVPGKSNLAFFDWAMQPVLSGISKFGVQVFKSHGVFDHSKLLVIDDYISIIGSANWDERSFRLNFEINTEIVSENFAYLMTSYFNSKKAQAQLFDDVAIDNLPLFYKLRNGAALLFKAYL